MIEPNFNALLWFFFLAGLLNSVSRIITGSIHMKKESTYDTGDAVIGVAELAILIYIWVGL